MKARLVLGQKRRVVARQVGAMLQARSAIARLIAVWCMVTVCPYNRIETAAAGRLVGNQNPRLNPLQRENQRPGTTSWRLNNAARHHEIEGFASRVSVTRGQNIVLYVSTGARAFNMTVYRMGWYGGTGARAMRKIYDVKGVKQPQPTIDLATHLIVCHWTPSYTLTIPSFWLSGIYLVKLTASTGKQRYIVFTVREDRSFSTYLVQQSVTTYQAYNNWGGYSLYGTTATDEFNQSTRAYAVSFDRPYADDNGAGQFFKWEYAFVRWVEARGYDVTYTTNIDVQEQVRLLLQHRTFISLGHDEYWSAEMRTAVEQARDMGHNLAFFGANEVYWNIRLLRSAVGPDRIIVCYKSAALDPMSAHASRRLATDRWRALGRPEATLVGIMSSSIDKPSYPMVMTNTNNALFAGTSFHDGSSVPGIVGYEFDRVFPDYPHPATLIVLASSPLVTVYGRHDHADMSAYVASSGAFVFAAGTIQFSWALDPWNEQHVASVGLQQLATNVMARLRERAVNRSQRPPLSHAGPLVARDGRRG